MRAIIFALLVTLVFSVEEDFPVENGVTVLTDATFAKALEKNEYMMVLFYAPWCGHCKKFKPEYEKAAATLRKENYICAKVDATAEKKLASEYQIHGYPTVKFFIKGKAIDYKGGRTEIDVVRFFHKKVKPPVSELKSVEDIEKFMKENKVCTIYYGNDKKELEDFTKVAYNIEEFPFGSVSSDELISKYSKAGTVILYKDFDEKKNEITSFDPTKLEAFYEKYSLPKVMSLNQKTMELVFGKRKSAGLLFCNEKSPKWAEYDKMMHEVYEKVGDKIKLFLTDANQNESKRVADYLGVNPEKFPQFIIAEIKGRKPRKFLFNGELTTEAIVKYVTDWGHEKLTEYFKTDPIPEKNDEDVFVVVGKNFKEEVLDNDKDVMVLFYAPWCGHCKKFHPIYEQIAKKLKEKNPKLLLTKCDAINNEVPGVVISGFPTIKFYPGNKKTQAPLDYNGKREIEDVIKFLKEHAFNKIDYEEPKKEENSTKTTDL